MTQRPTSVTVIAILGLVWAGFGVLLTLWGLIVPLVSSAPEQVALRADVGLMSVTYIGGCIGLLLNAVLVAGCIGALKMTRWSRPTLLGWAYVNLALIVITGLLNVAYVIPRTLEIAINANPSVSGMPENMRRAMLIGAIVLGLLGSLFSAALPVATLIIMSRKNVKEAFALGLSTPGFDVHRA